jgi:AcrR family transcriptional regulator
MEATMARPKTPLLSVDGIVSEALAMIDDGASFSVVHLAKRLGVNPSSLYNHVSGRDEIVELIRGRLADDFEIAVDPGTPWDEVVGYVVRRQRAMFAAHPLFLPLLVGNTVTDPRVISYYEELATALGLAGFPDAEVLDIVAVLDTFALGSGLDLSAPAEVWKTPDAASVLGHLLASADDGVSRSERAFELGLRFILAGLRDRLGAISPRATSRKTISSLS